MEWITVAIGVIALLVAVATLIVTSKSLAFDRRQEVIWGVPDKHPRKMAYKIKNWSDESLEVIAVEFNPPHAGGALAFPQADDESQRVRPGDSFETAFADESVRHELTVVWKRERGIFRLKKRKKFFVL